nr:MAG TPA: hypothetical protein [Caudoviricetes sp.]
MITPDNPRPSLENQIFPWYTPLISTAMLKYKRRKIRHL